MFDDNSHTFESTQLSNDNIKYIHRSCGLSLIMYERGDLVVSSPIMLPFPLIESIFLLMQNCV